MCHACIGKIIEKFQHATPSKPLECPLCSAVVNLVADVDAKAEVRFRLDVS